MLHATINTATRSQDLCRELYHLCLQSASPCNIRLSCPKFIACILKISTYIDSKKIWNKNPKILLKKYVEILVIKNKFHSRILGSNIHTARFKTEVNRRENKLISDRVFEFEHRANVVYFSA